METSQRNAVIHELADVLDNARQNRATIQSYTLFPTSQPATNNFISNLEDEVQPFINDTLKELGGVAVPIQSPDGSMIGTLVLTSWLGFDSEDFSLTNWQARPLIGQQAANKLLVVRCSLLETISDMRSMYPVT